MAKIVDDVILRWGVAVSVAVARARRGDAAAAWVRRVSGVDGPLPAVEVDADHATAVDEVLDATWRQAPEAVRVGLGQVFTPRPAARQLLLEMGFDTAAAEPGHLVDPACGGGIFLVEAIAMRLAALQGAGRSPVDAARQALASIHGVDLDPVACGLARAFVALEVALGIEGELDGLPAPSIRHADAMRLPATDPLGVGPFRWIVGNPPYLEAKRMPKSLRARMRVRFDGRLKGAFDYYVGFVHLATDWRATGGLVGLVLPNKVQVARYAESLRTELLDAGLVRAIVDLSEMTVFQKVGVYPVLLVLGEGPQHCRTVWRVDRDQVLGQARFPAVDVSYELFRQAGSAPVWFGLPAGPLPGLLERLLLGPRLEEMSAVRSTCSFHVKGLRERYVRPGAELPEGAPYLGGKSFARRNEVRPFRLSWDGFRIDYDAEALKALGNPMPPRSMFSQPKVIYCQHAKGLVAAPDVEGTYVTKDVFPVAFPRAASAAGVYALCGLLNSRLASTLYSLFFRGIQIGGRYLHILPVFLRRLPVPRLEAEAHGRLATASRAVVEAEPGQVAACFEALDQLVFELYGVTGDEEAAVRAYADEVLGFRQPVSERT